MKHTLICILLAHIAVVTTAIADEKASSVVMEKYKLAALTGLMHSALANYNSQLDPRGKQCVLLSVGHEFSGQFLFFATRLGPDHLEIVSFTPGADDGKEWSGHLVKYEGEVKSHFEKIHGLMENITRRPRERKEDFRPVHGEAQVEIRVGAGNDISCAQLRAGFIEQQPKLREDLLECISIASAMAKVPLPNNLE